MESIRFKIIFDKLDEDTSQEQVVEGNLVPDILVQELNEIDELRKIVLEIQQPEPNYYTSG